jgi:hypothetical protein
MTTLGGGPAEIAVRNEFVDCALLVADFRYIVKRKMRATTKIQEIPFGARGIATISAWLGILSTCVVPFDYNYIM